MNAQSMVAEVAAPRSGTIEAWLAHPRLHRHLRCLLRSDVPAVLWRYDAKAASIGVESLMRCMCHVGAWVALLPIRDSTTVVDEDGLSPVCLLRRLFQRLSTCCRQDGSKSRSKRLTPWLRGILALVVRRLSDVIDVANHPGVEKKDPSRQQWTELWMSLPRSLRLHQWGLAASCLPHPSSQGVSSRLAGTVTRVATRRGDSIDESSSEIFQSSEEAQSSKGAVALRGNVALPADLKGHTALLKLNKEIEQWASKGRSERERQLSKLDALLSQAESTHDWRKLLSVLRRAAAALSAPRRRGDFTKAGEAVSIASSVAVMAQQRHVRRMLLRALYALQGFEGDSRVDLVVDHVWMVIAHFSERNGKTDEPVAALGAVSSRRQWIRLMRAVVLHRESSRQLHGHVSPGGAVCVDDDQASACESECLGSEDRSRNVGIRAGRATIKDSFVPREKIRALPTIVHRPAEVKVLECEYCSFAISSSWFFVHPKTHVAAVLIPHNGHSECRRVLKRRAQFKVVGSDPKKDDRMVNVDFCQHGKTRAECAPCGGCAMCTHGKRRDFCRLCSHVVKRRKRKLP